MDQLDFNEDGSIVLYDLFTGQTKRDYIASANDDDFGEEYVGFVDGYDEKEYDGNEHGYDSQNFAFMARMIAFGVGILCACLCFMAFIFSSICGYFVGIKTEQMMKRATNLDIN